MKTIRLLSAILLIAFIFSTFSFLVYANEDNSDSAPSASTQNDYKQSITADHILSFSCHYNPQSETVNIKGTMNYSAFALHGDSTLLIYSIPSGKTENDVINDKNSTPLAEASVSTTFAFSFKISTIEERYYRYAIFIRTSSGEYILTTEAQYAESEAPYTLETNKNNFKGLSGNYSSAIANVNAQTTIIPIYLDLIYTNDSSGYVYQIEDKQFFFNKSYVNELDAQIRSLSFDNTKIYLQFLLRSNDNISTFMNQNAEYALPNVFNNQTVLFLHAITNFLVSRYSSNTNQSISGVLLGKAWDNAPKYNSFENLSFNTYVLMCGHYAAIISNAARDIAPSIDIMLSFDGNGFYIEQSTNATSNDRFSAQKLISSLMQYFDASSYSGLKCKILIESDETPLDITESDLANGINIKKSLCENKFHIGEQNIVSDFLNDASQKYKSVTKNYSVLWIPNSSLRGNALCAAYAYAFYKLWSNESITEFNVEFSTKAENKDNLYDLIFILKNIDSDKYNESTKNLLAFFNEDTWLKVIGQSEIASFTQKKRYTSNTLKHLPKSIKGNFYYFDFSKSFLPEGWTNGVGAANPKIDYLLNGEKSLKCDLSVGNSEFCDLIYTYDNPENLSYAPYIRFNFEIISEKLSPLYEIKIILNGEKVMFEGNSVVEGNQAQEIIINTANVKDFLLKGIKISVRSLENSAENCTIAVSSITGHSKKYSTKELNALIEKEREKQNNTANDSSNVWLRAGFVFIIVLSLMALGFILILIFKKNNRGKRKE